MAVTLLLIIVAILLFGAATVRSVLGGALVFLALLLSAIVVWAVVSSASLSGVLKVGGALIAVAAAIVLSKYLWARQAQATASRDAIQNIWDFYEKRGLFAGNEPVRDHAAMLREEGDRWALDAYCRSELKSANLENRADANAAVQRVWDWYANDIAQRFDLQARAQAEAYFRANEPLKLDRFCRSQLEKLGEAPGL